jgi:excisionase family DNA binding protein
METYRLTSRDLLPNEPLTSKHQRIALRDIAEYCMVSTSTVQRWVREGKLKSLRLPSNQKRISMADFMDFLQEYNIPISNNVLHKD